MPSPAQPAETPTSRLPRSRKQAPSPAYTTPFGLLADMRQDQLQFYRRAAHIGDIVRFQFGPVIAHAVFHPDYVKHVLQDNNQNYRRSIFMDRLKPVFGEGLFTSNGAHWRRQRRLTQPAFHRQRIAGFASLMTEATQTMLERWEVAATQGQSIQLLFELNHLTHDITGKALFGTDISHTAAAAEQAISTLLEHFNDCYENALTVSETLPTLHNYRFWQAIRSLEKMAYRIIAARRRSGHDSGDLLSMLLFARDEETGAGMTDKQLRDEVITFLGGGTETTAVSLTWAWYLLSEHPAIEHTLRTELSEVLGGRIPTMNDIPHLTYTRMVIEEALRLYPPAWLTSRNAVSSDEIDGYHIPARSLLLVSPYVTHRHPAFWENPERFEPERFTPERVADRRRYAYFPFGGGPRRCIGDEFAMLEAQLILATVAQQYRLHREQPVTPRPMLSLLPNSGVPMRLQKV